MSGNNLENIYDRSTIRMEAIEEERKNFLSVLAAFKLYRLNNLFNFFNRC